MQEVSGGDGIEEEASNSFTPYTFFIVPFMACKHPLPDCPLKIIGLNCSLNARTFLLAMRFLFPIVLCCFIGFDTNGQIPLESLKKSEKKPTLAAAQKAFNEWASDKNPNETNGWKWYKRWEDHYNQRSNINTGVYDPALFMKAAVEHSQSRNRASRSFFNWIPYGPDVLPGSPNPYSGHGMGRINCIAFHPTDPNVWWVGVAQAGVWKTSNGGVSWTPLTDHLPILRISDIAVDPSDPDILYICVGDFEYIGVSLILDDRKRHSHYGLGVYKTTDGGIHWTPTGLSFQQTPFDHSLMRRVIVDPDNGDNLVAAGVSGVFRSTDGGASWVTTFDRLMWDLEQDPVNTQTLYAASGYVATSGVGVPGVYKSTDFGDTWTILNTGIPLADSVQRVEIAIAPSDPNYIYATTCDYQEGYFGTYRSTDGGNTWEIRSSHTDGKNILGWYGGQGTGGQGTYDLALVVDPADPERIFVGGVNLWGSEDGGHNWDGISFWVNYYGESIHADQHQLKYHALSDRYFVCNDGGVMSADSLVIGSWDAAANSPGYTWPTVWEDHSSGMQITSFYRLGLGPDNSGTLIAGAQDNSTFYNDGTGWSNIIGGDGMECFIAPYDVHFVVGSHQNGNLARSFDAGQNIDYGISNPITDTGEKGEWTTPFLHAPDDPYTIYGAWGNLWKSEDAGSTWIRLSAFPDMPGATFPAPASALVQCRSQPATFYLAKRSYASYGVSAALWVTHDEGTNWTNITAGLPDSLYFTYLAVSDNDPQSALITCSGFEAGIKVFETTDGGGSWTNISGTLPNIPVNCVVRDQQSAKNTIYIGTDLGVWYLNDTLPGWQPYGQGLPNVIVSELEIDPVANRLYAATFGRGIWEIPLSENFVGLEDPELFANIYLSPNPADDHVRIMLKSTLATRWKLRIVDITGRTVYHDTWNTSSGTASRLLNIDLETAQYFLVLEGRNNRLVQTFKVK